MLLDEFHPEDIKAEIRKRYGSLIAFERAHGLARQSTSEVFRGRATARTEKAIRRVMRDAALAAKRAVIPINMGNSAGEDELHRQKSKVA